MHSVHLKSGLGLQSLFLQAHQSCKLNSTPVKKQGVMLTKCLAIVIIISLTYKRPAKHNAQPPEGEHKPQPVSLEVINREAPAEQSFGMSLTCCE